VEAHIQRVGKRWSATTLGGQRRRGYVKYGCPSHRNRGVCSNSVMIRKDRLEGQLLAELSDRLLQPAMVDYALQSFHEQLKHSLKEIRG